MDDEIKIELGESVSRRSLEIPKAPRPTQTRTVGASPGSEDIAIFIDSKLLRKIMAFASDNRSSECGGVLIGEVFQDDLGMYITIDAMIEAKNAASSHTSLTFTHETWDYIYRIKDENYPTQRIIGWFHTHPGFGVFLSKHDLFIHESFFNQEWQVALVVDPVRYQAGFFAWYDNEVGRVPGFFVFSKDEDYPYLPEDIYSREAAAAEHAHVKDYARPREPVWTAERGTAQSVYMLMMALLILTLSVCVTIAVGIFRSQDKLDKARIEIEDLSAEVAQIGSRLESLVEEYLSQSPQESAAPPELQPYGENGSEPIFKWIVQPGDTLWAVAMRIGPSETDERLRFVDELIKVNEIEDPSALIVGEELIIPPR